MHEAPGAEPSLAGVALTGLEPVDLVMVEASSASSPSRVHRPALRQPLIWPRRRCRRQSPATRRPRMHRPLLPLNDPAASLLGAALPAIRTLRRASGLSGRRTPWRGGAAAHSRELGGRRLEELVDAAYRPASERRWRCPPARIRHVLHDTHWFGSEQVWETARSSSGPRPVHAEQPCGPSRQRLARPDPAGADPAGADARGEPAIQRPLRRRCRPAEPTMPARAAIKWCHAPTRSRPTRSRDLECSAGAVERGSRLRRRVGGHTIRPRRARRPASPAPGLRRRWVSPQGGRAGSWSPNGNGTHHHLPDGKVLTVPTPK